MVTKRELEDLKIVNKALFEIENKGNTNPIAAKLLEEKKLIKPVYKNKRKKGLQTGSKTVRVFEKYNLTDKGKKSLKILSSLI